jgi:hypothetical protein
MFMRCKSLVPEINNVVIRADSVDAVMNEPGGGLRVVIGPTALVLDHSLDVFTNCMVEALSTVGPEMKIVPVREGP